ncbi:hypothetical protein CEXT_587601 [Caerostris extrusa]|uniref:Uncharacterized protein n=1 Tax=Caerostris extrusa TaxID=172846 RepID=A0AAV4R4E8_CAEEX|nr:hypothetical protein CEXT_587601 [Caerostris extrusa]
MLHMSRRKEKIVRCFLNPEVRLPRREPTPTTSSTTGGRQARNLLRQCCPIGPTDARSLQQAFSCSAQWVLTSWRSQVETTTVWSVCGSRSQQPPLGLGSPVNHRGARALSGTLPLRSPIRLPQQSCRGKVGQFPVRLLFVWRAHNLHFDLFDPWRASCTSFILKRAKDRDRSVTLRHLTNAVFRYRSR